MKVGSQTLVGWQTVTVGWQTVGWQTEGWQWKVTWMLHPPQMLTGEFVHPNRLKPPHVCAVQPQVGPIWQGAPPPGPISGGSMVSGMTLTPRSLILGIHTPPMEA